MFTWFCLILAKKFNKTSKARGPTEFYNPKILGCGSQVKRGCSLVVNVMGTQLCDTCSIPYSVKFWWGKILANESFQSYGEENFSEFTIA